MASFNGLDSTLSPGERFERYYLVLSTNFRRIPGTHLESNCKNIYILKKHLATPASWHVLGCRLFSNKNNPNSKLNPKIPPQFCKFKLPNHSPKAFQPSSTTGKKHRNVTLMWRPLKKDKLNQKKLILHIYLKTQMQ